MAKQQFEAEKAKGLPVEQEIEKYRKQVQEKVSQPSSSSLYTQLTTLSLSSQQLFSSVLAAEGIRNCGLLVNSGK